MGNENSNLPNFKLVENKNISIILDKDIFFTTEQITGKIILKLHQSCQIQSINISLIQTQFWSYSETKSKYNENKKETNFYDEIYTENFDKIIFTQNIINPGTFFNSGLNTINFNLINLSNVNLYQSRSFEFKYNKNTFAYNRYKLQANCLFFNNGNYYNNNYIINNDFFTETFFILKNVPDIKLNSILNDKSEVDLYRYIFFNYGKSSLSVEIPKNYYSIEDFIPFKIIIDNSKSQIQFVYFTIDLYCETNFKPFTKNFKNKYKNRILSDKINFIVEPGELKKTDINFDLKELKSSKYFKYQINGIEKTINKDCFYCTINDQIISNEFYIVVTGYYYNAVWSKPKIIFDINLGHYFETNTTTEEKENIITNKENEEKKENKENNENLNNNFPNVIVKNENMNNINNENNYPNLEEINNLNIKDDDDQAAPLPDFGNNNLDKK